MTEKQFVEAKERLHTTYISTKMTGAEYESRKRDFFNQRQASIVMGYAASPMVIDSSENVTLLHKTENKTEKPKEGKMKELVNDAKNFIKEHKSILYWVAIFIVVDHFVFNGVFRAKLKGLADKLFAKLEKKVDNAD